MYINAKQNPTGNEKGVSYDWYGTQKNANALSNQLPGSSFLEGPTILVTVDNLKTFLLASRNAMRLQQHMEQKSWRSPCPSVPLSSNIWTGGVTN